MARWRAQYNAGGACYHEVDEFLRKKGFAMYDILDVTRMAPYYFKTPGTAQFDQVCTSHPAYSRVKRTF